MRHLFLFCVVTIGASLGIDLIGCSNAQPPVDHGDAGNVQIPDAAGDTLLDGGEAGPPALACSAPLDGTTATLFYDAARCLFEGADPPQKGVAAGTIEPRRVAIMRGRVLDVGGGPLAGARVSVLHHSEYGETVTRTDGYFDMAVNGGGVITLRYEKADFLVAQRHMPTAWREFAIFPDVSLLAPSTQSDAVALGGASAVVRGATITDASGTRQPWVIFAPNTTAQTVMPDGTKQPLSAFHLRMTEYTVGDRGPSAMPGDLPATSGYTYATEFSVDEATKVGADRVEFDPPVVGYVDNFLHFPAGTGVPAGAYDRERDQWLSSDNGRVVQIVAVDNGVAQIDTDGDGMADDATALANLGIGTDELEALAQQYQAGQSAWRVVLQHFSRWDFNWPFGPPKDAIGPDTSASSSTSMDCRTEVAGSIIGCEDQSLGEAVALPGTPYSLHYQSTRVPGRLDANRLDIRLSGATIPPSLKRIELEVQVLGRSYQQSFAPQANLKTVYTWDGKDAFGRTWQGAQRGKVRVGYVYDGAYRGTDRFGYQGTGAVITGDKARSEITLWSELTISIGTLVAAPLGLGGFTLDAQHLYDPSAQILYLGNGRQRSAQQIGRIAMNFAGTGNASAVGSGDDGPALQAEIPTPESIVVAPDGSVLLTDRRSNSVRRISTTGIITRYAGTGQAGFSGDGGPATQAQLSGPTGLAMGADGTIYIADVGNQRLRAVSPAGIISTIAGGGDLPPRGNPGTKVALPGIDLLTLAPDGTVYFTDSFGLVALTPDGIVSELRSTLQYRGADAIGHHFSEVDFGLVYGIAAGPKGDLYLAGRVENRIWRIDPTGIVTSVAGGGTIDAEWIPAQDALVPNPVNVAVGPDGSVYFVDGDGATRVRRIAPDGRVATVAGGGFVNFTPGTILPAIGANLGTAHGLAVGPTGDMFIAVFWAVRRVPPGLPEFSGSEMAVASADGGAVYVFDERGKHLRTIDALTHVTLQSFAYDTAGHLIGVTDQDGNKTTITRDGPGNPTSIVGPFGQTTKLAVLADGYFSSVTNSNDETTRFTYKAGGLMETKVDPRDPGDVHHFVYDELGRLLKDTDASGYAQTLTRTDASNGYAVSLESSLGRTRKLALEQPGPSDFKTTATAPDGTITTTTRGQLSEAQTSPRASVNVSYAGDSRFGMQSRIAATTDVQEVGGPKATITHSRTVELNDPTDPFSIKAFTETATLNGRSLVRSWDPASLTWTATTPERRRATWTLDKLNHVVAAKDGDLSPVALTYDAQGRLTKATQDARSLLFTYGADGWLASMTDALGHPTRLSHDGAGRIKSAMLADGAVMALGYDGNGNLTAVTPPSRPVHAMTYLPGDLLGKYAPPTVTGSGTTSTAYTYDIDRMLSELLRPDQLEVSYGYDSAGRLSTVMLPTGTISYAYSATTGQLTAVNGPYGENVTLGYQGDLVTDETFSGVVPGSLHWTYDNQFQVTTETLNGGTPIAFAYDNDGLISQAGGLTINRAGLSGLISGTTLSNVTDSYVYNGYGEVTSYTARFGATTLLQEGYTRDALGRISEKTETIQGTQHVYDYQYDVSGRLTDVSIDGAMSAHYGYDANGNRTAVTTPGGTINATYDAQDRLLTQGSVSYTYGPNGELATRTDGGQTTTYAYDALGVLTKVVLPDGKTIEYVHDGVGRRVTKKVDGVAVQGFLYGNALHPAAELDGSGNVASRFIYGTRGHSPEVALRSGATYRLIQDQLGTTRLVVDATTGAVAQRVDYDTWGNALATGGFPAIGFAGGIFDPDTGFVRFGARDYDPSVGRWTAKDPLGFAGGDANIYSYAWDDPVNLVDPTGWWGVGLQGGAEGELGIGILGAGGQIAGGGGIFWGGNSGINTGAFGTIGTFAGMAGAGAGYPSKEGGTVIGASGGGGGAIFLTNAKSVAELRDQFRIFNLNVGLGLHQFGFQFAWGGGTWFAAISPPFAGGTWGLSGSFYDTFTKTVGGSCK